MLSSALSCSTPPLCSPRVEHHLTNNTHWTSIPLLCSGVSGQADEGSTRDAYHGSRHRRARINTTTEESGVWTHSTRTRSPQPRTETHNVAEIPLLAQKSVFCSNCELLREPLFIPGIVGSRYRLGALDPFRWDKRAPDVTYLPALLSNAYYSQAINTLFRLGVFRSPTCVSLSLPSLSPLSL